MPDAPLQQGRDYYVLPDGRWVFTARYLLARGECCRSGCRDCPYGYKRPADADLPLDCPPALDKLPRSK